MFPLTENHSPTFWKARFIQQGRFGGGTQYTCGAGDGHGAGADAGGGVPWNLYVGPAAGAGVGAGVGAVVESQDITMRAPAAIAAASPPLSGELEGCFGTLLSMTVTYRLLWAKRPTEVAMIITAVTNVFCIFIKQLEIIRNHSLISFGAYYNIFIYIKSIPSSSPPHPVVKPRNPATTHV
jgi:hypothetical protein